MWAEIVGLTQHSWVVGPVRPVGVIDRDTGRDGGGSKREGWREFVHNLNLRYLQNVQVYRRRYNLTILGI